jgi:hypothetical protein
MIGVVPHATYGGSDTTRGKKKGREGGR